ncbi:hypothetical protein [Paludibaculum fermentans]|uniref:hypothetical protein n=1 Tax=Paludibaculum fermentans TaxID=1473598 RepID=UPI003EBCBA24
MRLSFFRLAQSLAGKALEGAALRLPSLDYPLIRPARIAVLGLTVRQEPGIHVLPDWDSRTLAKARPFALAGWHQDLVQAGRLRESGHLPLADLNFPLLVFSTPEQGPLTESDHAELWRWFGLPVYEQIRTLDGQLVAEECETRNGFHLAPRSESGDGMPCDCGHGVCWTHSVAEPAEELLCAEVTQSMAASAGD